MRINLKSRIEIKINQLRFYLAQRILPNVQIASSAQLSMITRVATNAQSEKLIDLACSAAMAAKSIDLQGISELIQVGEKWPDIWPGEHYKLLAGLMQVLRPKRVVEVGTFLGLSALTMKQFMPSSSLLITYDILSWDYFSETCLKRENFDGNKFQQRLGDLSDQAYFDSQSNDIRDADFIFLDGPKDIIFEKTFLKKLLGLTFSSSNPILVIDDIRL